MCSNPVDINAISVDGDRSDWEGIEPCVTDQEGDVSEPGLDVVAVYMAHDKKTVYFLYEFTDISVDYSYLFLDTDLDASTGCPDWDGNTNIGFELGITFVPSGVLLSYIGDARDCGWSNVDFPGALLAAVGENFIEASVSIDTLASIFVAVKGIDVSCANDKCAIFRYDLQDAGRSNVRFQVEGMNIFRIACINLTTAKSVFATKPPVNIYDCKEAGLSIKSGDLVVIGSIGRAK